MEGIHPALALALALAIGVLAQSVARHNDVQIEKFVCRERADDEAPTDSEPVKDSDSSKKDERRRRGERFVMLAVRHADTIQPMSSEHSPKPGDVATVALHVLGREDAVAELAELGWIASQPGVEEALAHSASASEAKSDALGS